MNEQTKFLIEERAKTINQRLKSFGMTNSTRKTYCCALKCFFKHIGKINDISGEEARLYLDYLMLRKNYKARSRNLIAKIIDFYAREFLQKQIHLPKAKEAKPIPKICWDHEFEQVMKVTRNTKHKLCLLLMRYSGLRRSEVIKVMKHHVMPDGKPLVRAGKGKKDRFTIIPPQVMRLLQLFIATLPKDNDYVFQSQDGNGHYSKGTPKEILHNAFKQLGWSKNRWFGCHALRHAFCVYCLDDHIGDYDQVSKWLGHSVKQTTQIYTRCRKEDYVESIKRYKAINCIVQ